MNKMAWRKFRFGTALSLGGIVAAAPLIAACGGDSYEDWAATDGAGGRINLDDVQEAFKDSKSATVFEQRVNEIYEGDGLVLIRARQDGEMLTLEGWEDLNNDNAIEDAERRPAIHHREGHQRRLRHAWLSRERLLQQPLRSRGLSVHIPADLRHHSSLRRLLLFHTADPRPGDP